MHIESCRIFLSDTDTIIVDMVSLEQIGVKNRRKKQDTTCRFFGTCPLFCRSSEIDQIVSCRILSFTDIRMGTGQSFGRGAAGAKVCRSGYHSDLSFDPYHITLSLSLSYQLDHITSSMRNIKRFHNINQCKDRLHIKCKSRWKLHWVTISSTDFQSVKFSIYPTTLGCKLDRFPFQIHQEGPFQAILNFRRCCKEKGSRSGACIQIKSQ